MRSLILIPAAALALSACTRPTMPAAQEFAARELAGRVAGPAQMCVSQFPGENLRVIDASTLAYGSGATIYVNHLAGPCPAIEPMNTIQANLHGGQYCRGDQVRGIEPGAVIPGPWCVLGKWVPYRTR